MQKYGVSRWAAFNFFKLRMGRMPPLFWGDEKNGADVAWRRWRERHLGREGLHLLADEMIVLALRGGAKVQPQQGERWGGIKVRAEALHGFQGIRSAAKVCLSRRERSP
jgi:hypothetical protein